MRYEYGEFQRAKETQWCPRCKAMPGEDCKSPKGVPWRPPHSDRIAQMRELEKLKDFYKWARGIQTTLLQEHKKMRSTRTPIARGVGLRTLVEG